MRSRPGHRRRLTGSLLAGCLVASALVGGAAPAAAAVRPCSAGLVALTFDDGPAPGVTPRLLTVLADRHVPATFFVVGRRVAAAPGLTRRMSRLGFVLGNQTYHHEVLTSLGDSAIRATLRRTRAAVRHAGASMSRLMRPPYGAIDGRVRAVVAGLGLVPVLWTADPRDWAGRSAREIAAGVLAQLRPHEPNVVLLHDGVGNSPATLAAVPRIVRAARARGYCFARLGGDGRPAPPVPRASVSGATVTEGTGSARTVGLTVGLDRPTSRPTSVRVRTEQATAIAGDDFRPLDERVRFPAGVTSVRVQVRVVGDRLDEPRERLRVRLAGARGLRLADPTGVVRIVDDDPPPRLSVGDAEVVEPGTGTATVQVPVRLSTASGRRIRVDLRTVDGTATAEDYTPAQASVVFAPGQTQRSVAVTVVADTLDEPAEKLTVEVVAVRNAVVADGTGTVTVLPPAPGT